MGCHIFLSVIGPVLVLCVLYALAVTTSSQNSGGKLASFNLLSMLASAGPILRKVEPF
jgi:hypothetical protein